MGKKNRERRKAKARKRGRSGSAGGGRTTAGGSGNRQQWEPTEPLLTDAERASELLEMIVKDRQSGHPLGRMLGALREMSPTLVRREAAKLAERLVAQLWNGGWQPSELARQARRRSKAPAARMILSAIAVDHVRRDPATLDERWVAQIDALAFDRVQLRPPSGSGRWIDDWFARESIDDQASIDAVLDALENLASLPRLDELIPQPGATGERTVKAAVSEPEGATAETLNRIRALLAKAESSSYEAEALAFTAKAQEMMARHAIDRALIERDDSEPAESAVMVRVPIDAPYADAKSLLLQIVADASRCRCIFHSGIDMSTVAGFPADVDGTVMLFTSLLVQAQSAMEQAAASAPPGTRTRSQSYRSAFLISFANRIADRLAEINSAVMTEAERDHGSSLLPALAARDGEVGDAFDKIFGERLISKGVRGGFDAAGHASGAMAADRAKLNFGDLDDDVSDEGADRLPLEIAN